MGIFEFLPIDDEVRRSAMRGDDNATLGAIARKNGMKTLREDGQAKADQGLTTHAEIAAVCQMDAV